MLIEKKLKVNWSWIFIVFSSLYVSIVIFFDINKEDHYSLLPLLPLTFMILNLFSLRIYNKIYSNIGLMLVISLYYCRLVLVPFLMYMGSYSSLMKINVDSNMPSSIVMLIYEIIIVYFVIHLMLITKLKNSIKPMKKQSRLISRRLVNIFGLSIIIIVFFDIAVYVLIPESRLIYTNIIETLQKTSDEIISRDMLAVRGGLKRALLTLYSMTMEIIRVIIPAYLIIKIRSYFGEKKTGILLSLPLLLTQFLLVSNTHARSVICAFILMLLIAKLYPTWSTKLYKWSLYCSISFIILYFYFKFSWSSSGVYTGNTFIDISRIANAYFSGPDNIAAVLNVGTEMKWHSFLFNFYYAIPFNGTLFGLDGSHFSSIYNEYNRSQGQIGPLIGEGLYYLGPFLAPLLSSIFVILSIKYGEKAKTAGSPMKYITYMYFVTLSAMSLVMYNLEIFMSTFTSLILPMLILTRFIDSSESIVNLDQKFKVDIVNSLHSR